MASTISWEQNRKYILLSEFIVWCALKCLEQLHVVLLLILQLSYNSSQLAPTTSKWNWGSYPNNNESRVCFEQEGNSFSFYAKSM